MTMSALTVPAGQFGLAVPAAFTEGGVRPHLMGVGLPAPLRTVGALALLLLAVAVTGVLLVAFALVMPVLLIAALVSRRWQPRSERAGWRPAPA